MWVVVEAMCNRRGERTEWVNATTIRTHEDGCGHADNAEGRCTPDTCPVLAAAERVVARMVWASSGGAICGYDRPSDLKALLKRKEGP